MYKQIQSIQVIYYSLFLLVGDTYDLHPKKFSTLYLFVNLLVYLLWRLIDKP